MVSVFDRVPVEVSRETLVSSFGQELKAARRAVGLTQLEAASALGVSGHQVVCMWESGAAKPRLDMLVKICKLYHTTPNSLLGF